VDRDAQANLTVGLGINLGTVERSMADVLADSRATMDEVVLPTQTPGIDVAPSTLELASTEVELFTAIGREQALREALTGWAQNQYDYVLVDCPPTLGLLTINGLVAADSVIIPVQTQYYALKGLTALLKVINQIRAKGLNRDLRVMGLLPTFYDGRTILGREMLDELRELGDHHVFSSIIRQTVKLGEAPLTGRPVTAYASSSEAARSFRELAREVIDLGQA
jgi:chromosome partitioning protein